MSYTLEVKSTLGVRGVAQYPGFETRDEAHEYFRLRLKPWGCEFVRVFEDRSQGGEPRMSISDPRDPIPCPKCGRPMTWGMVPCPEGRPGCCVAHYGYSCALSDTEHRLERIEKQLGLGAEPREER